MLEIERKFSVRKLPDDLGQFLRTEIVQGYLALDPTGVEVRLRRANADYCLTVKKGRSKGRYEHNVPLTAEDWAQLWPMTAGRRLFKIRFNVQYGRHVIELDVFLGLNNGLVLAEVEFPDSHAAHLFEPPRWLGEEVTGIPYFSNYFRAVE